MKSRFRIETRSINMGKMSTWAKFRNRVIVWGPGDSPDDLSEDGEVQECVLYSSDARYALGRAKKYIALRDRGFSVLRARRSVK